MTAAGKIDKPALRRDAAARVAKEILDASPAFTASAVDITARHERGGRMVVTLTVADGAESSEDLAQAADRLLSRFPFDHRIVFRKRKHPDDCRSSFSSTASPWHRGFSGLPAGICDVAADEEAWLNEESGRSEGGGNEKR